MELSSPFLRNGKDFWKQQLSRRCSHRTQTGDTGFARSYGAHFSAARGVAGTGYLNWQFPILPIACQFAIPCWRVNSLFTHLQFSFKIYDLTSSNGRFSQGERKIRTVWAVSKRLSLGTNIQSEIRCLCVHKELQNSFNIRSFGQHH